MRLLRLAALLLLPALLFAGASDPFIVKPYLQLGDAPSDATRLSLLWHARDADQPWSVDFRTGGQAARWRAAKAPATVRVAVPGVAPHRVLTAVLAPLRPGRRFEYRVRLGREEVFRSEAQARPGPGQPLRLAVVGDIAYASFKHRAVMRELARTEPMAVLVPGDIVYTHGRITEYRSLFFPVLNAGADSPEGAPLLRRVPLVGVIGNHDAATTKLHPDALAYYYYLDGPLNGPDLKVGGPHTRLDAPQGWEAFLAAAGPRYPRMGSFSFDLGDAHITALDSNPYVDWRDPALRAWLERDLAGAAGKPWRIVTFHHPGFQSARTYQDWQWMRQLAPIFEKHRVSLVVAGHVHGYQRSKPLRFLPDPAAVAVLPANRIGAVAGRFAVDGAYDGRTKTRPDGVVYVVSGAGGAPLYEPELGAKPAAWQPFTAAYAADRYSFTLLDISRDALRLTQVDDAGVELDRAAITR